MIVEWENKKCRIIWTSSRYCFIEIYLVFLEIYSDYLLVLNQLQMCGEEKKLNSTLWKTNVCFCF